jgi:hypothetical protein
VALALPLALLAASCSNASDDEEGSGGSDSSTDASVPDGDVEVTPVEGVPGVTDTEIQYSALGIRTGNPLGTCVLDCMVDGIEAYFAFRNSEGGVHGRDMVLTDVVDDELTSNDVRALEIVTANDTFGTFSATQVASGWETFAEEGVPLYVWAIHPNEMAGNESIFGNREPACLTCTMRVVPYVAEMAEATTVGSLGYGVSESSQLCSQANADSVEQYGDEVGGLELGYLNDDLAFGLPNGIGPEVTAMREAGVDFIAACLDLNGMKTLAQELERQGIRDEVTMLHPNTYDQAFVEEAGDLFVGDYVSVAFRPFEAEAGESALDLYREWMEETGSELTEVAMTGWINADLAYQGLVEAGPDFTRQSVIDATNAIEDYTATGLIAPVDWGRQHEPATQDDPGTTGPEFDCAALVQVNDDREFEVVGEADAPFTCWPGDTRDYSEPEFMGFD